MPRRTLTVGSAVRELPIREPNTGRVLGTRWLGRKLVEIWHAGPKAIEPPDVLDFAGVELASSPFLDELHKAWPHATISGANEDISETWGLVVERG